MAFNPYGNWNPYQGGSNPYISGRQQPVDRSSDYYQRQVFSDPYYQNLSGYLSAQSASDAAERSRGVQQALIQFGYIPDLPAGVDSTLWGADVNDLTRQLAQQNTAAGLSGYARLDKRHGMNVKTIQDMLAARGLMQSGELGYQLGEEGLAYRQAINDATTQLLDFLYGTYDSWADAEAERRFQLANEAMDAAGRRYGDSWSRYYTPTAWPTTTGGA